MAIQDINLGTEPLGTGGDTARAAFNKVNENFDELDTRTVAAQTGADASLKAAQNLADLSSSATARANIGLGNVNNTSDADKPVSTATQAALEGKEAAGAAAAAMSSHTSAPDPHPQYATLAAAAAAAPVQSVAGRGGDVVLGVDDINGLRSVLGGGRNRLINANFRINQRGYVSGTATAGANQYTLDRWRVVVSGQSVTFTASGNGNIVTAPAGGYEQVIEGANIEGGIYTLSWTGTATATVNGTAVASGAQTGSLTAGANVTIRFASGTVSEAQFEPVSVATPFDNRHIALELLLCRRYCQVLGRDNPFSVIGLGHCTSTTGAQILVPIDEMRTVPTLSFSGPVGTLVVFNSAGTGMSLTGLTIGSASSTRKLARLNATVSSGLVAGNVTSLNINNDLNYLLILDAEL